MTEQSSTVSEIRKQGERLWDLGFIAGLEAGLRMYAWWKDGVEFVGCGNRTLAEALKSAPKDAEQFLDKARLYSLKMGREEDECRHYIPEPKKRCMICYPEIARLQTHSGD